MTSRVNERGRAAYRTHDVYVSTTRAPTTTEHSAASQTDDVLTRLAQSWRHETVDPESLTQKHRLRCVLWWLTSLPSFLATIVRATQSFIREFRLCRGCPVVWPSIESPMPMGDGLGPILADILAAARVQDRRRFSTGVSLVSIGVFSLGCGLAFLCRAFRPFLQRALIRRHLRRRMVQAAPLETTAETSGPNSEFVAVAAGGPIYLPHGGLIE